VRLVTAGLRVATRAPVGLVAAMLVVRLADESASFLPFGIVEDVTADLGLTYAQVGWVFFLIAPGAWIGNAATVAADVVSRRVIATGGALGYALSLTLFAVGDGFLALGIAALVLGMASTAMVDAIEIALVDLAGDDLAPALARTNLLSIGGELAGPALLAAVVGLGWSWRVAFAVAAVAMVAYGLWLSRLPIPRPAPLPDDDRGHRSALLGVVRDPRVWALGVVSAALVPLDEPFFGFLIAFLRDERGWSASAATLLVTTSVIGGALAYAFGARVQRRLGDRGTSLLAALVLGAALVVLVAVPAAAVLVAAGTAAGGALGLLWLSLQHRMLTLRPGRAGAVKALVTTVEVLGFLVPVGIGALADERGLTAGLWVYAALPVVMVVALLGATGGAGRSGPRPA
jgi:predicted MFS family arabinose efflux permease